jgi:two-component system sensor histidine kinase EvgS
MADALRLRQVLGNLLSNAIKFTDTGQVTLEYVAGAVEEGDEHGAAGEDRHREPGFHARPRSRELLLAVSDTGIGIAEDQQALLFAPFVQARQERPGRFGGTGLGLSICRRLMTMMGGTIELASQPGQGSRFTMRVRLPVARPPLEAVAPTPVHEPDTDDLLGLRVLVVDDHPANRILLASQLNTLRCVIETANDGEAAFACWDRARQEGAPFDLILTDCSMPTMSGEDLARAIRAREMALTLTHKDADVRPIPIVGVTANAQPEAVTEAIVAGMTLCLVKPLGLDMLRHALELAVRDARASKVLKASTPPMVVAISDSSPAVNPASRFERASNASVMHVSTAAIGSARHSGQACVYGPTRNFPSNIVARRAVLPAPGAGFLSRTAGRRSLRPLRYNAGIYR